ncbi:prolipoprotein diacylglyceryl transferase [bacterium BMS3Bbin14]|nr:prolipoprotein diacylglyceryl transferase [bacterium BMS3Abin13]GBE52284.1 prolipoprotein diacylglyceryl transferase [bacterium BMS3Bbin14]
MPELLFILSCSLGFAILFTWGFRHLPGERWQMLAVVPSRRSGRGSWQGTNFTFYGFLVACSTTGGALLTLILLRSVAVGLWGALLLLLIILAVTLPAAKIMARVVEKKRHTFTIGGAFFCGLVMAPWVVMAVNWWLRARGVPQIDMIVLLAALAIGYTLGEGLGRLACVSFGCCYGKPVKDCGRLSRLLFGRLSFVFTGPTKKAVYEGALEGERLVPVQAMTSILYTATAMICAYLFLTSHFVAALLISLVVSQVWRFFSETLRADFRGLGKVSAYQKMSLAALPYIAAVAFFAPQPVQAAQPSILQGLTIFTQPVPMISLQLLWFIIFLVFGRSTVTASTVSFHLVREHVP